MSGGRPWWSARPDVHAQRARGAPHGLHRKHDTQPAQGLHRGQPIRVPSDLHSIFHDSQHFPVPSVVLWPCDRAVGAAAVRVLGRGKLDEVVRELVPREGLDKIGAVRL